MEIVVRHRIEGKPMPLDSFQVRAEDARALAVRRLRSEELARQQQVLDDFERDKLEALMTIRSLILRYGPERVRVWVDNQAKEAGL